MSGRHGYGKERFIGPPCEPAHSDPDPVYGIPQFTDYRRACKADGCMVRLTSETRADARLLCVEHGREYDREKQARLKEKRREGPLKAAATRATPEYRAAAEARKKDRELRDLLKQAIPAPVREPPKPYRTVGLYRDRSHELTVLLRKELDAVAAQQRVDRSS